MIGTPFLLQGALRTLAQDAAARARAVGGSPRKSGCGGQPMSTFHERLEQKHAENRGRLMGEAPVLFVCQDCHKIVDKKKNGRCLDCNRINERNKSRPRRVRLGSTASRGYGATHKRYRRAWAVAVEAGRVNCTRCGLRIEPGQPWDLGHSDENRRRYSGPEHAHCNRATAGREQPRHSRVW
jgi:hypothetical protein